MEGEQAVDTVDAGATMAGAQSTVGLINNAVGKPALLAFHLTVSTAWTIIAALKNLVSERKNEEDLPT